MRGAGVIAIQSPVVHATLRSSYRSGLKISPTEAPKGDESSSPSSSARSERSGGAGSHATRHMTWLATPPSIICSRRSAEPSPRSNFPKSEIVSGAAGTD
ncbi:hypothetical protein HYPP_02033 [Hyphomicrobium sp. ghe19]|nr:hypothetical protein HYPP_02033 [Hyphomicrobium sp. ghe19]